MSHAADKTDHPAEPHWLSFLAEEELSTLTEITRLARSAGIKTLVGGALGLAAYTPLQRSTKDIDLYVRRKESKALEQLLRQAGFRDLYEKEPYDRGWISRSYRGEVIVDIIWSFANYLAEVDDDWFRHGPFIEDEVTLQIIPPEELLQAKLFVFQRGRCDWPDLINLLYYTHDTLDRERLIARLGEHGALFNALEDMFKWLVPSPPACDRKRADLLDSREWFLPTFTRRRPPLLQRQLLS